MAGSPAGFTGSAAVTSRPSKRSKVILQIWVGTQLESRLMRCGPRPKTATDRVRRFFSTAIERATAASRLGIPEFTPVRKNDVTAGVSTPTAVTEPDPMTCNRISLFPDDEGEGIALSSEPRPWPGGVVCCQPPGYYRLDKIRMGPPITVHHLRDWRPENRLTTADKVRTLTIAMLTYKVNTQI